MRFRAQWITRTVWDRAGTPPLAPLLARAPAVGVRGALDARTARSWSARVDQHRGELVRDFGGDQLALGRAFYTHLETDASSTYFAEARASDALVERVLPGMQDATLALFARMTGAHVRRRAGFAGPGVHVFPAREIVARTGGSVHHDVEGLAPAHLGARAYSLVVMLTPPRTGGGLTLWNALHPSARRARSTTTSYRAGDALLFSSYRLHQIRGFTGARDRVSITALGVEVDHDVIDVWF